MALTPSEQKLKDFNDDPARREARAKEALDEAIRREQTAGLPTASTLTPAEQELKDFFDSPERREAKAKKALEDAKAREAAAASPAADTRTPSEKKLADFNSDPARREERAAKALEDAKKREAEDRRSPASKAAGQIGKNLASAAGLTPGGPVSGVVGKLGAVGAALSPFVSVIETVVGKFASIIGPMAILQQAMSSTVSGFGVLQKATNLVATAIAPVLLPVTLVLAAGMSALATVLTGALSPVLDQWFDIVLTQGIPAMEQLVAVLAVAASTAGDLVSGFHAISSVLGTVNPSGSGGTREAIDRGLTESIRSLRASIGPKATISSLGGVGQAAQLAALNNDPLEARLLRQQVDLLTKIESGVNRHREAERQARVYDPGDGTGVVSRAARSAGRVFDPLGLFRG